jgi:hypothetical protein
MFVPERRGEMTDKAETTNASRIDDIVVDEGFRNPFDG